MSGRIVPPVDDLDLSLPLVRTDYSDDAAFARVLAEARRPTSALEGAQLLVVEHPSLDGVEARQVPDLVEIETEAFVADARTMVDGTLLVLDAFEESKTLGDTFRVVPDEVANIEANLVLANVDFEDFADAVDDDGVFRGFDP